MPKISQPKSVRQGTVPVTLLKNSGRLPSWYDTLMQRALKGQPLGLKK